MKYRGKILLVITALVGGIVGGIVSNARPSSAQVGPTKTPYIQTGRLELLDQSGKVRIRLAISPENKAAGVVLYDATHTNPAVVIQTLPDGTSNIQLQDENGQRRASFDYMTQGVRLALLNSSLSGGTVLAAGTSPSLTFSDRNEKARAGLGLSSSDNPTVQLLDGTGTVLWSAPPTPNATSHTELLTPPPTRPN